jgi:hypothetical protein
MEEVKIDLQFDLHAKSYVKCDNPIKKEQLQALLDLL